MHHTSLEIYKMIYVVIFLFSNDRYYVSKTFNPNITSPGIEDRNNIELYYRGSTCRVIEIIPDCKESDVDKYTKIYIEKYGVNKVRGGSFISINDEDIIKQLEDFEQKDEITIEIEKLQNKILKLEKKQKEIQKQKEIDEENSKKLPFDDYFHNLSEFIKQKHDTINPFLDRGINQYRMNMNGEIIKEHEQQICNNILKQNGYELLPALDNIYNALDNINKRLIKLEMK